MKKFLILLIVFTSLILAGCGGIPAGDFSSSADSNSTKIPATAVAYGLAVPDALNGKTIFVEKCAPCHGETGLGDGALAAQLQKAPAPLADPNFAVKFSPASIFNTVTDGRTDSFMPSFKDSLTAQQIWDVSGYVFTLTGSTAKDAIAGKALYEQECVECHGTNGALDAEANLTDITVIGKLTQNDLATIIINGVAKMPGLGESYPRGDVDLIAAYVRTFTLPMIAEMPAANAPEAESTVEAQASQTEPTADVTEVPDAVVDGTPSVDPTVEASAEEILTADPTAAASPTPVPVFGNVTGQVTNGSTGVIPTGLRVQLHGFSVDEKTQQYVENLTVDGDVNADGGYTFEHVSFTDIVAFYTTLDFENATFNSDPVYLTDGQTSISLPLTYYESTTDISTLKADQVHLILDYSKQDVVQVLEFLIFSNSGTKTIVGQAVGGPIIDVPLPEGYTNLQFESGKIGDRYLKTKSGFSDTISINPGAESHQIVFTFELPLSKPDLFGSRSAVINQPIPFAADKVTLMAPNGVSISGSGIQQTGQSDLAADASYKNYTFSISGENKAVTFTVKGTPEGEKKDGGSTLLFIVLGALALGLVLIVVGIVLKLRKPKALEDQAN